MRTVLIIAALITLAPGAAMADKMADHESVTLVHRFTLPARLAWGTVSISLAPQAWRVGHLDGPVATEAQLRIALGELASIEIGGRCAGWVEGATSYPCGFAVGEIDLAGSVGERFSGVSADWQTPGAQRRLPGTDRPDFRASGLIAPVLDAPRFVSVRAPLRYLGDKAIAFGGKLDFRIRAVSNALVPSEFDRSSGTVILRGGRGDVQAGAPAEQRAGKSVIRNGEI